MSSIVIQTWPTPREGEDFVPATYICGECYSELAEHETCDCGPYAAAAKVLKCRARPKYTLASFGEHLEALVDAFPVDAWAYVLTFYNVADQRKRIFSTKRALLEALQEWAAMRMSVYDEVTIEALAPSEFSEATVIAELQDCITVPAEVQDELVQMDEELVNFLE